MDFLLLTAVHVLDVLGTNPARNEAAAKQAREHEGMIDEREFVQRRED